MVQIVDIFAKPMICLLSAVTEYFHEQDFKFVPESIFLDVTVSPDARIIDEVCH